jgi:hypothetical protein
MLEAKIGALQTLREGYLKAHALGALGQPGDAPVNLGLTGGFQPSASANSMPVELPTGAFLNMSIPEAIRLFLSAIKRKQTAREIAVALKDGGMESMAANWETTVTGALHRLKTAGAVLRFKDGWGLADHYPESLRARLAKDEKPRRTRKAKKSPVGRRAIGLTGVPTSGEKAS